MLNGVLAPLYILHILYVYKIYMYFIYIILYKIELLCNVTLRFERLGNQARCLLPPMPNQWLSSLWEIPHKRRFFKMLWKAPLQGFTHQTPSQTLFCWKGAMFASHLQKVYFKFGRNERTQREITAIHTQLPTPGSMPPLKPHYKGPCCQTYQILGICRSNP